MKSFPLQPVFQELFNKSYAHIVKQGRMSVSLKINSEMFPSGVCAYRSEDGCGCGAAPFITNYKPQMENLRFDKVAEVFPNDIDPDAARCVPFVCELQQAHDNLMKCPAVLFINRYKSNMSYIAERHGLEIPA